MSILLSQFLENRPWPSAMNAIWHGELLADANGSWSVDLAMPENPARALCSRLL